MVQRPRDVRRHVCSGAMLFCLEDLGYIEIPNPRRSNCFRMSMFSSVFERFYISFCRKIAFAQMSIAIVGGVKVSNVFSIQPNNINVFTAEVSDIDFR